MSNGIALSCLTILLVTLLGGCVGAPTPLPTATPTPAPSVGLWTARVEFGAIRFVVNATGTGISRIDYDFSGQGMGSTGWNCGSQYVYGNVAFIAGGEDWPIREGCFAISTTPPPGSPLKSILLDGTMDASGSQATGTFRAVSKFEEPCGVTWSATRPK
jgi:hypothetical protein